MFAAVPARREDMEQSVSGATDIETLLRSEGFDSADARMRARALLEEQGLTRPGKLRIATEKVPRVRDVLTASFLRICGNGECARLGADPRRDGREVMTVSPAACEVCGGSNNRRAALLLARTLKVRRIDRLLIVGGTPTLHTELEQLLSPHGLQLRYVDGAVGSHSARDAAPDLQWAQVVVIWGASPLPHKVSKLYTDPARTSARVVKFARRGIEALCSEVARSFD